MAMKGDILEVYASCAGSNLGEVAEDAIVSPVAITTWNDRYNNRKLHTPGDTDVDKEPSLVQDNQTSLNVLSTPTRIDALPEDILRAIFVWLCPPSFGGFLPDPYRNEVSGPNVLSHQELLRQWLRITCVCRLWRDIALSSPTMWSTIAIGPDDIPNEAVEMQLRRSANTPIDVHAWFVQQRSASCAPYDWRKLDLRAVIPRLRSFHLHPPQYNPQFDMYKQLTPPAPLLEHLTLTPDCMSFFWLAGEPPSAHYLPTVFANQTPLLKSLTLCYFTRWPGNDFKNLTRLCLMHQNTYDDVWEVSFLFKFLKASPDLEEVVFFHAAPLTDDRDPQHDPDTVSQLCLPRLRTLVMTGWDAKSTSLLLSALELGPSCVVVITSKNVDQGASIPDNVSHLSPYMRSMTRLNLRADLRSYCIVNVLACGQSGMYYNVKDLPVYTTVPQTLTVPTLDSTRFTFMSPALLRLYSMMDLQELRIEIHDRIHIDVHQWRELYKSMPGIFKLVIVVFGQWKDPSTDCLTALCATEAEEIYLRNLIELHVVHVGALVESFTSALRTVVTGRSRCGMPIQKLVVGSQPSLQFPAGYLQRLEDDLEIPIVPIHEAEPIDLSPFDQNDGNYSSRYWPSELRSGGYPTVDVRA